MFNKKEEEEIIREEILDEERALIKEGNISLILDSYNDIFSSFDPRPYSEKAISVDFLAECKNAARDKQEGIELRLLIPKKGRNAPEETSIKRRLRSHFHKHFLEQEKELKKIKQSGALWAIIGIVLMIISALIITYELKKNIAINLLEVIMVPAGWFLFWEGLDKILIEARAKRPEHDFYRKMAGAEVSFRGY